ncbi:pyridoxamine 5'-phosphate oxidase family protein [Microbacterium sp. GXF7504]
MTEHTQTGHAHSPENHENHENHENRETLVRLMKDFRFAMLATVAPDGSLVAHPLTVQDAEFDGDLWFVLSTRSTTAQNLARDRQANVSLSSNTAWVSLSGEASFVEDRAKLEEVWSPVLEAWFPDGIDDPSVGLLKFTADGAEYWHSPGGVVVRAVALLRGKPSAGSENETVDL